MTNILNIPMRVRRRNLRAGDVLGALSIHHVDRHRWIAYHDAEGVRVTQLPHEWVQIKRPTPGMVTCPGCGDPMGEKRLDERATPITKGVCSECVAYPRRHAIEVERERRVAAFGEGRC